MTKIGLVILNYITYNDTYESIMSLNKNSTISNITIFVIDNETKVDQYRLLQQKLISLNLKYKIVFLSSKENLGFAKGMNIGIIEAKKYGCNYIICSNNDIIYNKKIIFDKLINIYNTNNSIAVIGPKILSPNLINQNPYMIKSPLTENFLNEVKQKIIFNFSLGKYIFLIRGILRHIIDKDSHIKEQLNSSNYIYCLHGAYFMLTPAYFKYYQDLDPNTFLYVEELILAERIRNKKLKEYYCNEVEVFHKDDSSTNEMLGKGSFKKTLFILNENYQSLQYFMKEYVWK